MPARTVRLIVASCSSRHCAKLCTGHTARGCRLTLSAQRLPCSWADASDAAFLFGSHAVRTYLRWRNAQGLTSAILFADVSSAYYSTVRDLAAKLPSGQAGHTGSRIAEDSLCLADQVQLPSAMAQTGAHPWLQAVTATLNNGTFMCLRGDDVPLATRRGTRPGSAWADLTFGVVIARILRLRDACKAKLFGVGQVPVVPWDGARDWRPVQGPDTSVPLADLIWADDLSIPLAIEHAEEAAKAIMAEAGSLTDAFEAHGFALSFGPRKTAVLVSPRGPRSRCARRSLFAGKSELPVLRESNGIACVPLVDAYNNKHLGVVQTADGGVKRDIKQRISAAWGAFREGRTRLFRCRRLSLQRRGALLSSLVMSKLTFGAGAWPPLPVGDMKLFSGAVFSLYRATLGLQHDADQRVTLAMICSLLGLPEHATILKLEQLRYLKQLCNDAPDAVWALLRQDDGYLGLLRDALCWLFTRIRATCTLPDPLLAPQEWVALITGRPSLFKGFIARAKGLEQCRITCYAALQALGRLLQQLVVGEDCHPVAQAPSFPEACLICRRGFMSRSAWACHASKKAWIPHCCVPSSR